MEPKHDTALSPKGSAELLDWHTASDTGRRKGKKERRMHSYPALLCSCVVSILTLCHGFPLPADPVRNLIKLQAENIITRIQKQKDERPESDKIVLDGPELFPGLPSDKPIEGLTSEVETLSAFQMVLHSLPKGHVTQIRFDVSKLQSDLEERMSSLQCPHKKTGTWRSLEVFLGIHKRYPMNLSRGALDRLQDYLKRLIHNLDQLKTC